jgi:hypothetical protein
VRTFDARGHLLGDTSVDTAAPIDASAAVAPAAVPALTVSVAPATFTLAQLLQPPYIYFVVAALGIAAWLYRERR